jgi:hypothetical protein
VTDTEKHPHPRQVTLHVTMSNGVKNGAIFTLHRGDYSFVEKVEIDRIEVGYEEMPAEDMERRRRCTTQEVGHKIPAKTVRKQDGRMVGSCETCFERFNIEKLPATEHVYEAQGLLRTVLFDKAALTSPATYLPGVLDLELRLKEDRKAIDRALSDMARAKSIMMRRATA